VSHIAQIGPAVYLATELGDSLRLDLTSFHQPYCALLRSLWARVPVVWEDGRPRRRAPPTGHRCRSPSD